MGLGSASGLTRGAGVLPTGPRRPPRPQPPVGPRTRRRTSQERRETAAEPTAHTSPSPPSEAPRISRGSAGRASWPSDPAEDCAGQRGGRPAPGRVPAPSPAPHPRCACAHLRHRAVRCGRRAPWGRALDGRLVAKRLQTLGAARGTFPRALPGRGAQRTWGLPGARGGREPARWSHPRSRAPRPGPCRRRHLPGCQLGMRGGPAPGPDINNPGEGGGWRGGEDALRWGEPRRPGEGRAAGAGAEGGKARGQITAQLGLQTHPWG